MRGHGLSMLQRAAIPEVGRDAGRAEAMIADRRVDAGRDGTVANVESGPRWLKGPPNLPRRPKGFAFFPGTPAKSADFTTY
jgi:hypothetical protein